MRDSSNSAFEAFESYIDSLSDEKLDAILAKIDDLGIQGPSVINYFSVLERSPDYVKQLETKIERLQTLLKVVCSLLKLSVEISDLVNANESRKP